MKTQVLRRSALALVIRVGLLLFLIDTIYALLILVFLNFAPPAQYYFYFIVFLWALHTVKYIIITFLLLRVLLLWVGRSYLIDGKYLTVSAGVYAVTDKVYDLSQLKQIQVHQDWVGRTFHFGTVSLGLSGTGPDSAVDLVDIVNPKEYESTLSREFM